MLLKADSLDDALGDIARRLLRKGSPIRAKKGRAREFTGVLIELSDPRARLSRTEDRGALISFLGETLWYLSGSDSLAQIEYYIPKYRTFIDAPKRATRAPGAYGPRLFGGGDSSQMSKLLKTMKEKRGKSDTRQAVAQIFDRRDLKAGNGDVPCTTNLQFLPRKGKLNLSVTMRSNDIYRGFPGDVFAFTFIQEMVARALGLDLGIYSHYVGSLHLYDDDRERALDYLAEGIQAPMSMPAMPEEDPRRSVAWLLDAEKAIRCSLPDPDASGIDDYWLDLARLLRAKVLDKRRDLRQLVQLKDQMASPVYDAYMRGRQLRLQQKLDAQPDLLGMLPAA